MSRTRVSLVGLVVDGPPEDVDLTVYEDGEMTLRLGHGVILHLGQAPVPTLRAIAAALNDAADEKAEAAIVADNTPAPRGVPDNVHTMRVPDWGAAS